MADNWIVEAGSTTVTTGGTPIAPGNVTLGTPKPGWELIGGAWHFVASIPVTPPASDPVFDRMFVYLQAPDDTVATNKAFLSASEQGFFIDDDPTKASRIAKVQEPILKAEIRWNPEERIIRVTHPEPSALEKWRVSVASGSPQVRNALIPPGEPNETPSVVFDASPHPDGGIGSEVGPNARNVTVEANYVQKEGADWFWYPKVVWVRPTNDPRYAAVSYWDIVLFDPQRTNDPVTPEDDRYPTVSGVGEDKTQFVSGDLWRVPNPGVEYQFFVIPRNADGARNTIVPGVTGSAKITVAIPTQAPGQNAAELVTGFDWTWDYTKDPTTGRKKLNFYVVWTKPANAKRFGGVRLDILRADNPGVVQPITGIETGESKPLELLQFPVAPAAFTLRAISVDANGVPNDYVAGVTPEATHTIDPPKFAIPLQDVTGFSVTHQYLGADYYGKTVLRLIPAFTKPSDPSWAYIEFWGRPAGGNWRIVSYPSASGLIGAGIWDDLPATSLSWDFLAIAQDVDGRNRNGDVDSDPDNPPVGTPTFTLTIPAPTGKLDGGKIQNIVAASFAAGLAGVGFGTVKPALPDASYPAGTSFWDTSISPPKLYRVNSAGTAWTAVVDGGDIVARSIIGLSLAVGAVSTSELFAGEFLLGQGGGKPTRFKIVNSLGSMIGFIGDDSTIPFLGAFFTRLKVANAIASTSPRIEMNNGLLEIEGGSFKLDLNNVRTLISNSAVFNGVTAGMALQSLAAAGLDAYLAPGYFAVTRGGAASPLNAYGYLSAQTGGAELALYNNLGVEKVHLYGASGQGVFGGDISILDAAAGLHIGGNTVLGSRRTGWGVPTGSFSRATFDTATVTMPALAQVVAALIRDCHAATSGHGFIGT